MQGVLERVDGALGAHHGVLDLARRLAVLLHRGRSPGALPDIDLHARARTLEVAFPKGWLAEHPLTAADLEQESEYLQASGFRLKVA